MEDATRESEQADITKTATQTTTVRKKGVKIFWKQKQQHLAATTDKDKINCQQCNRRQCTDVCNQQQLKLQQKENQHVQQEQQIKQHYKEKQHVQQEQQIKQQYHDKQHVQQEQQIKQQYHDKQHVQQEQQLKTGVLRRFMTTTTTTKTTTTTTI